jgi:hypothetical protein
VGVYENGIGQIILIPGFRELQELSLVGEMPFVGSIAAVKSIALSHA